MIKKRKQTIKYNKILFKNPEKKGFISVIIPVFKDYIGLTETLKSIKNQTLNSDKFEVIVANDGNNELISKTCEEFDVTEIKISPNRGSYNARNKALEVSRGEYLAFTDADVMVNIKWLENGKHFLNKYDYVCGPVQFKKNNQKNIVEKYEELYDFNIKDAFKYDYYGVTANLFTKRNVIEVLGGFDNRLKSGGDNEFGNRVHYSSQFTQFYSDNFVVHPHRNYHEILIKKQRVSNGINALLDYFPKRYKKYTFIFADNLIYTFIPPFNLTYDLNLFFFFWYMKFVDLFINLFYRNQHMQIFNENSIFLKIKRMILQEKIPTNIPNP